MAEYLVTAVCAVYMNIAAVWAAYEIGTAHMMLEGLSEEIREKMDIDYISILSAAAIWPVSMAIRSRFRRTEDNGEEEDE